MNKSKIMSIFERVLEKYCWAKDYAIHHATTSIDGEKWEELEREIEEYKMRMTEALN